MQNVTLNFPITKYSGQTMNQLMQNSVLNMENKSMYVHNKLIFLNGLHIEISWEKPQSIACLVIDDGSIGDYSLF